MLQGRELLANVEPYTTPAIFRDVLKPSGTLNVLVRWSNGSLILLYFPTTFCISSIFFPCPSSYVISRFLYVVLLGRRWDNPRLRRYLLIYSQLRELHWHFGLLYQVYTYTFCPRTLLNLKSGYINRFY